MASNAQMQTIEMFGKQIEYDPSKTYGTFNSVGQYGVIPVEKTLPRMAQVSDKTQFLEFLDLQVESLNRSLKKCSILEGLVNEGVLDIGLSPQDDTEADETGKQSIQTIREETRQAIQNTIELFEYMARTLRS